MTFDDKISTEATDALTYVPPLFDNNKEDKAAEQKRVRLEIKEVGVEVSASARGGGGENSGAAARGGCGGTGGAGPRGNCGQRGCGGLCCGCGE